MHVGVARIALELAENSSLKGKRMVVRSVVQRVRNRFNVAIAEVDTQDVWETITLGMTCVSDDPRHANEMLSLWQAATTSKNCDVPMTLFPRHVTLLVAA
jgi:uncharacterized protein YlxP (DUF503 family)